ncbi:MAG: type II toxin-antitoxin system RelE/ParE family toxin [Acidobacteria bacterium]|nr:type II toxin-antitoxin system RelE/ParE family toxin [Acidobacteriota bacterium]
MKQYKLTEEADDDLIGLWLHLSQTDLEMADRQLTKLIAKFELLSDHPLMGRLRPEFAPDLRSFIEGRYLIFYRLVFDEIEIVRIIHGARDLGAIFH